MKLWLKDRRRNVTSCWRSTFLQTWKCEGDWLGVNYDETEADKRVYYVEKQKPIHMVCLVNEKEIEDSLFEKER